MWAAKIQQTRGTEPGSTWDFVVIFSSCGYVTKSPENLIFFLKSDYFSAKPRI